MDKNHIIIAVSGYILLISVTVLAFIPLGFLLESSGYGIVDFQLAWTQNKMEGILHAWGGNIENAILLIWVDFLFIIGTGIGNLSIISLIGRKSNNQKIKNLSLKVITTYMVTDIVENICSLLILYNFESYPVLLVQTQTILAVLKFVTFFLMYSLIFAFGVTVRQK